MAGCFQPYRARGATDAASTSNCAAKPVLSKALRRQQGYRQKFELTLMRGIQKTTGELHDERRNSGYRPGFADHLMDRDPVIWNCG